MGTHKYMCGREPLELLHTWVTRVHPQVVVGFRASSGGRGGLAEEARLEGASRRPWHCMRGGGTGRVGEVTA